MTQLRFQVPVPADTDPAVAEAFAAELAKELEEAPGIGPVMAEPLGPERSLVAVGTAISVVLPDILTAVKVADGILTLVERLRKLRDRKKEAPDAQKPLFAGLDPDKLKVRVPRGWVALTELTDEDLEALRSS